MKNLLLSFCLLLMVTTVAYGRPAVLDLNTLKVDFQCLRIVNCDTISEDVCYRLLLQYTGPNFTIQSFQEEGVFPKENDDQSVDCQTLDLDIPYIAIGPDAYHVTLKYHPDTGEISINGFEPSTITPSDSPDNGTEQGNVAGSCYVINERADIQDMCQTYYGEDEELLKMSCYPPLGRWVSHEKCSNEDIIGICKDVESPTPHDTTYYDHGILAVMAAQGAASLWIQSIENTCHQNGGVWVAGE